MSILDMVEVISAPSNERFLALILSIYKLISRIFFVDIEAFFYPVLMLRINDYLFGCSYWLLFFIVGLVDVSTAFFLKSELRSLTDAEYFVFAYFI